MWSSLVTMGVCVSMISITLVSGIPDVPYRSKHDGVIAPAEGMVLDKEVQTPRHAWWLGSLLLRAASSS